MGVGGNQIRNNLGLIGADGRCLGRGQRGGGTEAQTGQARFRERLERGTQIIYACI